RNHRKAGICEWQHGNHCIRRNHNDNQGAKCNTANRGGGIRVIRIIIAEDQGMLLGALGSLLNLEDDMEVVGKAKNGEKALELVNEEQPDICIMDIEMPVKSGLDAAEELKDHPCKVIILTTFARAGYFERARKAGVRGYLLKDSPIEELANAIRSIMDNQCINAPALVYIIYAEDNLIENPHTESDSEVLKLVSPGKTTKDISV